MVCNLGPLFVKKYRLWNEIVFKIDKHGKIKAFINLLSAAEYVVSYLSSCGNHSVVKNMNCYIKYSPRNARTISQGVTSKMFQF